ncbi:MAG TPA: methylated-DNA--[protein]-cysteine S-methyltransferase [Bacteroides sp.]|nr:methylated-DNA--[protein]-cysteine S-methyltransferase [Bacteroides sp.]
MNKLCIQYYKTAYGELILGSFEDKLCLCDWRYRKMRSSINRKILQSLDAQFEEEETPVILTARNQLDEYFSGARKEFEIPLLLVGTAFQKSVWNELLKIPYGQTETYLGLSEKLGDEKAIRAVANANGANAISIIVPCHRIVGSKGEMVGYAGGVRVKEKLLGLESDNPNTEQMNLFN